MAIPEVELAVGKIGRVHSPLDPAPISMIETVINYKSEYIVDKDGRPIEVPLQSGRGGLVPGREGQPAAGRRRPAVPGAGQVRAG